MTTREVYKKVIEKMSDLNVWFHLSSPAGGFEGIDDDELLEMLLIGDPDVVLAKREGVSLSDYKGWVSEECRVRCSAITKKGTQCTNHAAHIKGEVDVNEWVKNKGEYCGLHGDRY